MILHFDLDAFFASVAIRDDRSLLGKPVAIAHTGRRSVVLTASYEARPYGVHSALPLAVALRRCPHLTVVAPNMERTREASRAVFAIFASEEPDAIEGLSLDEAYLAIPTDDVGEAVAWAARIRTRVLAEVGLTISAGVATNKMAAKIASDSCKPNGMAVVQPGAERAFLAPLPIGRLWGIGPKTQERMESAGIKTIGDLADLDDARAFELLGRWGREARDMARGIDLRAVEGSRVRKSISTEETFEYDVRDEARVRAVLAGQADEMQGDLKRLGLRAATIGVKIKRADFTIVARQTTLLIPTDRSNEILIAALDCWERCEMIQKPLRLVGTRCAALVSEANRELTLFDLIT
jgi:DNA polymerase-4